MGPSRMTGVFLSGRCAAAMSRGADRVDWIVDCDHLRCCSGFARAAAHTCEQAVLATSFEDWEERISIPGQRLQSSSNSQVHSGSRLDSTAFHAVRAFR